MSGAARIATAIGEGAAREGVALVGYVTGGYPTLEGFGDLVRAVGAVVDVVEVGLAFSDPMADGGTIQRSSGIAVSNGASADWLLGVLADVKDEIGAPVVVMSYLNPLVRMGLGAFARRAAEAGVDGVVVPDLPVDEAEWMAGPLRDAGLGVVAMATPVTDDARLARIGAASSGFTYAVTRTGTTGAGAMDVGAVRAYLERVRAVSVAPVCAGFGVRTKAHVDGLRGACEGVVVGSAVIEAIDRGEDPAALLAGLR